MAENWELNYLTLLSELIKGLGDDSGMQSITVSDGEDYPTLTLVPDFGGGLYRDVELRISIEHILEGTNQLRLMVTMFTGVSSELLAEAEKVVARINEFMILGNAAIFYEGLIFYTHAFGFDPSTDIATVTAQLGSSLSIAIHSVPRIMDILAPVLEGKITADALIADGIDLIQ